MEAETLEQAQTRHRKEVKELQGRITSKKKNATKKTRKGVNDECEQMERALREKQLEEIASLNGDTKREELEAARDDQDQNIEPQTVVGDGNGHHAGLESATSETQPSRAGDEDDETVSPAASSPNNARAGQKRNRHKERLARRAAEQEAATRIAEQQATQMTDHRAQESTYMKNIFKSHNLTEQEIAPDGHCLFSAVADQLSQNAIPLASDRESGEPKYKTVRTAAAGYMLSHADDFAPFLEEDLEEYAAKIRDTAEWGGQLELVALSRRYGVEIRVVQDGSLEKIGGGEDGSSGSGKILWLAYYRHGYGLGEHYNSLRAKEK